MNKNIWFLLQIIAVVVNVLIIILATQNEVRFVVIGMFIGFVYARNFFQKELFNKNE